VFSFSRKENQMSEPTPSLPLSMSQEVCTRSVGAERRPSLSDAIEEAQFLSEQVAVLTEQVAILIEQLRDLRRDYTAIADEQAARQAQYDALAQAHAAQAADYATLASSDAAIRDRMAQAQKEYWQYVAPLAQGTDEFQTQVNEVVTRGRGEMLRLQRDGQQAVDEVRRTLYALLDQARRDMASHRTTLSELWGEMNVQNMHQTRVNTMMRPHPVRWILVGCGTIFTLLIACGIIGAILQIGHYHPHP
jgi:chromosome segregation ATPase